MKKLITTILTLCIIMTAMPFTCFAEESSDNIIILNDDITFNTDTNTMYFKSNPNDRRFFDLDEDWYTDAEIAYYKQREELLQKTKKVVIENGVNKIDKEFFHDLPNLEEVVLPNTLKEIGEFAFWNCPKLKTIYGENVTTISSGAFGRCTSLKSANFPNLISFEYRKLDLYYLDEWGEDAYWRYPVHEYYVGAFQECTALDNIYIPNVKKIGAKTFYKCSSLTTINENNKLDKVYTIGRTAFYGCKSLKTISLQKVNRLPSGSDPYSDSKFCEGTFGYCTSLTSINIPKVSNIGNGCFYGCSNLKTINDNNQLNNVETLGAYAFNGCKNLKTISLKNVKKLNYGKWNYYKSGTLKFMRDADVNTEYLENCYGKITDYLGLKYAGVFENCTSLKTVTISGAESIGSSTFKNCGKLQSVDITSAKNIGTKAFYKCSSLKTINIPKNVKTIGVRAFARCSKLKTINIKATAFDTIGLDAFKIIDKTPTFNCPKSKLKTYKKLIKPNAPAKAVFKGKY